MVNLNELRDRVISRGFPELMAEDIHVEYKKLKDALLEYGSLTEEGYYIEIDESLIDAPKEIIVGGLAHEFSHILTDKSSGKRLMSRDRFAYGISSRYKTLDERNTDLEVILRGFGKELLNFLEYSETNGYPYYKDDGLSIREVKKILGLMH